MFHYTAPLTQLIEELKRIPGVGRKSAQRIAFWLLKADRKVARQLADAIVQAREQVFHCSRCHNITVQDPCEICRDEGRDRGLLCVVEEPFHIYSIERTGLFGGLYHVLLGALSPIRGIGPDELRIASLVERVRQGGFREVILATSATTEGNATAFYLTDILREYRIVLTRIAMGLPVGADLDYADQVTIAKAFEGRREIP